MNRWFIAIKERGENIKDLTGLTILNAPEGHYWADPFLAEDGNKTYLFFEDYDYKKGRLAVGELDGLQLKNVRTILDEPHHMSFPSVFQDGEDWYMTPECVLSGELRIFKAIEFPDYWDEYKLVARGRFDDPVLYKIKNGYQIWTNEDGDKSRVFEARTLDGDWNLIKAEDEQYSRSAGHFIGNTRVAQDSLPVYGHGIVFKEGKSVKSRIEPTWYPDLTGTHTYNVSSKYCVIDGRIKL